MHWIGRSDRCRSTAAADIRSAASSDRAPKLVLPLGVHALQDIGIQPVPPVWPEISHNQERQRSSSRVSGRACRALIKPQEPDSRTLGEGATNGSLARRRVFGVFDEGAQTVEQLKMRDLRAVSPQVKEFHHVEGTGKQGR